VPSDALLAREIVSPLGTLRLRPEQATDATFLFALFRDARPELALLPLDEAIKERLMHQQFQAQAANYAARYPQALGAIVDLDGRPIAVPRKSPRKPLELLKALIAAGGRGIDKQRLADLLWADAAAEDASAALDMAIMRLRKLLAAPEAIVIEDGKIGLDTRRVWLDSWAFDRDVDALLPLSRGANNDAAVAAISERILALYRGPFLDNEEAQGWLLAARERTRQRFMRSLSDAGRYWERREQWSAAAALFERGLEIDPLAEELYRRLMRCHLARRRPSEAARVFQRCREMLLAQLGVPPSAETEALLPSSPQR